MLLIFLHRPNTLTPAIHTHTHTRAHFFLSLQRFDSDSDGLLTFSELRQVIAGKADLCRNIGIAKRGSGEEARAGAGVETEARGESETDSKNLRSVDGRTPYV